LLLGNVSIKKNDVLDLSKPKLLRTFIFHYSHSITRETLENLNLALKPIESHHYNGYVSFRWNPINLKNTEIYTNVLYRVNFYYQGYKYVSYSTFDSELEINNGEFYELIKSCGPVESSTNGNDYSNITTANGQGESVIIGLPDLEEFSWSVEAEYKYNYESQNLWSRYVTAEMVGNNFINLFRDYYNIQGETQLWMFAQEYESNPMKFEVNGDLL
jgi:hypothetical protein